MPLITETGHALDANANYFPIETGLEQRHML